MIITPSLEWFSGSYDDRPYKRFVFQSRTPHSVAWIYPIITYLAKVRVATL